MYSVRLVPSALHFGQEVVVSVGEGDALELDANARRGVSVRAAVEERATQARDVRLLRHADYL